MIAHKIGPSSAGMTMTPEEFDSATDWNENYRYELIRGVLVVSPPPLEAERDPNEELGRWLRNYREDHPRGMVLDATLSEHTVRTRRNRRRADRVIWVGLGRRPDPKVDVPAIIIEFVSAGKRGRRRDYVQKRREYLAIGVNEYWVIDRFRRTLTVYRAGEPAEQVIPTDGVYRTDLLPGFELPLARLLGFADRWASAE